SGDRQHAGDGYMATNTAIARPADCRGSVAVLFQLWCPRLPVSDGVQFRGCEHLACDKRADRCHLLSLERVGVEVRPPQRVLNAEQGEESAVAVQHPL